jgi:hypothetical protein
MDDEDGVDDIPYAPPRWDGGDWGCEPSQEAIGEYVENSGLMEQRFAIEGQEVSVISDPSHVMFQGVGGSIWNASLVLSKYLSGLKDSLPQNPVVLELGSGCGLPSVYFARTRPDAKVILTDVPHLLPLLKYNIRDSPNCEVLPLTWGSADHLEPLIHRDLDLIIGSDIVFDPDYYDVLLSTMRTLRNGTATHPRKKPAKIVLALAMREPDITDFWEACARNDLLADLRYKQAGDSWASATGIYECTFGDELRLERKRSASDSSTTCSTP